MMNILDFQHLKREQKKISMVTCYDYWSAKIIATTAIDCVLVGDSVAMVMHGHKTPIPIDVQTIALHTQAVAKGIGNKFLIADMPFLSYRQSLKSTMKAVEKLIKAGAQAVKLEGAVGNLETIHHIVTSGVPVMGHLGLTAQSFHQIGGFRVQGKQDQEAKLLCEHAQMLEGAGCFAMVLECIPAALARKITQQLSIPTIGIGAGVDTDGQVLVLQDLLGLEPDFKPKFLKHYFDGFTAVQSALNNFNDDVKKQQFPTEEHCY